MAEACPEDESKSFHLIERLLDLYRRPSGGRPLKVIVFSQFRAAVNVVGDRLLKRFGTGCVAEYFGKHRTQELHKFTYVRDCFCLLLTKDGAEGLDLSFVTNIMFLEEIYDKSLEDQAVARAWRMGATGRVDVETLIAKNSVEEEMGRQASNAQDEESLRSTSDGADRQRLRSLLQGLRLVTDYYTFGQRPPEMAADINNVYASSSKRKLPSSEFSDGSQSQKKTRVLFKLSE
jgi:SNF2 family DNA or RNA helicase